VALLDSVQLDAMASGRPELLLPIVSDFETHGREQLSNLQAALTEGRLGDGRSILHQLKGASGTMGMIQFEELCRECEEELTAGQIPPRLAEFGPLLLESVAEASAHLRGEVS